MPPPAVCPSYPHGTILVGSDRYMANGAAREHVGMVVSFERTPSLPCTGFTVGSCAVSIFGPQAADAGSGPTGFSAGPITVSGGASTLVSTPMSSIFGSLYPNYMSLQALWSGGEAITVSAAGADVPAFSTTLMAPRAVAVTAPVWPDGGPMTLPRDQDLTVRWSGISDGWVEIGLDGGSSLSRAVSISCRFSPSSGQGVVPAALLAQLPSGDGGLLVRSVDSAQPTASGWNVEVTLGTVALDSRAMLVSYQGVSFP